jgi:cytochrome b561
MANLAQQMRRPMATAGVDRAPISLLLALAAGLLGLIHDSWEGSATASSLHYHASFGALLWGSVMAEFYFRARRSPCRRTIDIHAFSRRLSRWVYLLLYVLMFFNLAIDLVRGEPHRSVLRTAEDFQSYLACGCVALVAIHILAVPFNAAAPDAPAARKRNPLRPRPRPV